jgi:hypothetical protein
MIDSYIKVQPISINIDFEKAVFNAIQKFFLFTLIYGCFSIKAKIFLKECKKKSLTIYNKESGFRKSFNMNKSNFSHFFVFSNAQ